MDALVIDACVALGFLLKDEQASYALKTLEALEEGVPTFVPVHWSVEVANGLIMAERRGRASQADTSEALDLVNSLPVIPDDETAQRVGGATAALARQYRLTVYDAAYLELAMRMGAALATTDRALVHAARAAGVAVFE